MSTPRKQTVTPQCVYETLALFPDLLDLHRADPGRYPCLLESVARPETASPGTHPPRYDILFAFPRHTVALYADGGILRNGKPVEGRDFLQVLDAEWRDDVVPSEEHWTPPFRGGWFLYFSYEFAGQVERGLRLPLPADDEVPIAVAVRCPAAVIRDHATHMTYLVAEGDCASDLMTELRRDVERVFPENTATLPAVLDLEEDEPRRFLEGVARIQEYIRAGDVFQVNLSRGWHARFARFSAPTVLYRRLRAANPSPFAGLFMLGHERAIVSSSPERLVSVRSGTASTRPIAGTRPRSASSGHDRARSRALLQHPKERAEHVMLIDLERNDLGRVCVPGSVRVSELMTLESYRFVHHIVSEVIGRLRPVSPGDVIRALFPGGTITGCPKIRCMQIIAELEQGPREAYTGSMGYLNRDGDMDLNILIRTLIQDGATVRLRAGSGIVADSVAAHELEETRAKARGLLAALTGSM